MYQSKYILRAVTGLPLEGDSAEYQDAAIELDPSRLNRFPLSKLTPAAVQLLMKYIQEQESQYGGS